MSKIFLTFGDGSEDLKRAANRLGNEAKRTGFFDQIIVGDLEYIKKYFYLDYLDNIDFIKNNNRGFGYWIWKPIILKGILEKINTNDLIFYSDAGCELSINARSHFKFLCNLAIKHEGLFFQLPYSENAWTKADIFNDDIFKGKLNCDDNQVQATFFLLQKNRRSVKLINDWYFLARKNNYHYINDSPSVLSNHPSFVENRHDQSILSCLVKLNNYYILPTDYFFPREFYFKKSPIFKYFIHPLRNKTGKSLIGDFQMKTDKKWLKKSVLIFLCSFSIGEKILKLYRFVFNRP